MDQEGRQLLAHYEHLMRRWKRLPKHLRNSPEMLEMQAEATRLRNEILAGKENVLDMGPD